MLVRFYMANSCSLYLSLSVEIHTRLNSTPCKKKTAAATNVVEPLRRNGMQSAQNWIVYSKNWIMNYALWCYICSSIVWLWVCMFFCSTNLVTTQWPDIGIDLITTLSMEQCARLVLRPYCYHKYKINTQHPRARACTKIWWMENPSRMLPLSHEMNGRVNWIASPVSARPKCEATIVLCCEFFFLLSLSSDASERRDEKHINLWYS